MYWRQLPFRQTQLKGLDPNTPKWKTICTAALLWLLPRKPAKGCAGCSPSARCCQQQRMLLRTFLLKLTHTDCAGPRVRKVAPLGALRQQTSLFLLALCIKRSINGETATVPEMSVCNVQPVKEMCVKSPSMHAHVGVHCGLWAAVPFKESQSDLDWEGP